MKTISIENHPNADKINDPMIFAMIAIENELPNVVIKTTYADDAVKVSFNTLIFDCPVTGFDASLVKQLRDTMIGDHLKSADKIRNGTYAPNGETGNKIRWVHERFNDGSIPYMRTLIRVIEPSN